MYFSKMQLHPQTRGQLASRLLRDDYRMHQTLWRLFPEVVQRDFLFRRVEGQGAPIFYLVSHTKPSCQDGLWELQTKPYQPRLQAGQRLAFSLLANPVVTRRDPVSGRAVRHDVVMDARKRQPELSRVDLQQQAGRDWLQGRAERYGFALQGLRVDGYRQHRLRGKAGRPIRYSTLTFDGLLEVVDSDRLLEVLARGIGSAKAFGCGLLLVRPT